MKSVLVACFVLSALVAGCATTEDAKKSWASANYDEVARAWGQPQRSGKLSDGTEVHTWVSESGPVHRSGPSVGFGVGGARGTGGGFGSVGVGVSVPIGSGTVEPPARCERTLSFRDGRLVEQSWIGDDAVCAGYTRAK